MHLPSDSVPDYQDLEVEDWLRVQRIVAAGGALDDAGDEDGNSRTYLGNLERR